MIRDLRDDTSAILPAGLRMVETTPHYAFIVACTSTVDGSKCFLPCQKVVALVRSTRNSKPTSLGAGSGDYILRPSVVIPRASRRFCIGRIVFAMFCIGPIVFTVLRPSVVLPRASHHVCIGHVVFPMFCIGRIVFTVAIPSYCREAYVRLARQIGEKA